MKRSYFVLDSLDIFKYIEMRMILTKKNQYSLLIKMIVVFSDNIFIITKVNLTF